MTLFWERSGRNLELGVADFQEAIDSTLQQLGEPKRVFALPPDHTRLDSRAGEITCLLHKRIGSRLVDVMPALGTHVPMEPKQLDMMFPGLPHDLIRPHRWRDDVVTLGEVDAEFVRDVTDGHYNKAWPAQVNRLLVEGNHDAIFSIGQVVPHEVIGMANYNKNIFVGTGGSAGIHESHYLSAMYGMERIMGRADSPLRKVLNEASDRFCKTMPIVYMLTVVESLSDGRKLTRGLYVGDEHEVFWRASQLSSEVNCIRLEKPPATVVVFMHPKKYTRTWLANKAIYRTRMAVGDGGRLVVIAPGVKGFGEDPTIDRLIAEFGYRTTPEVLRFVESNQALQQNLSAAAHLIHGSPEDRFEVVYCTNQMSPDAIRSVGYSHADPDAMIERYRIHDRENGWHTTDQGEEYYFIQDPGLGLWMHDLHPHAFR